MLEAPIGAQPAPLAQDIAVGRQRDRDRRMGRQHLLAIRRIEEQEVGRLCTVFAGEPGAEVGERMDRQPRPLFAPPVVELLDLVAAFVRRELPVEYRVLGIIRSEEHTSELQSRENLVCRLLLEKKKS